MEIGPPSGVLPPVIVGPATGPMAPERIKAPAKPPRGPKKTYSPAVKPPRMVVAPEFRRDVITVKFKNGLKIRAQRDGLVDLDAKGGALKGAKDILDRLAGGKWQAIEDGMTDERRDALRAQAENNLNEELADLSLYHYFVLPVGSDPAAVIDQLNALDIVEIALPMPINCPTTTVVDSQYRQLYLNPTPDGINALFAWNRLNFAAGIHGEGVKFADVENSFNPQHQDLPQVTVLGYNPGSTGALDRPDIQHGTNTLGTVVMKPNGLGGTGIAYGSLPYFSSLRNTATSHPDTARALQQCQNNLSAGDVVVIEVAAGGLAAGISYAPDYNKATYDRIRALYGLNITVVEGAGNGIKPAGSNQGDGVLLDNLAGDANHYPFQPQNASGAIIVGAGRPPIQGGGYNTQGAPRSRIEFSNYGSIVSLQGYGYNVFTAGSGDDPAADNNYAGYKGDGPNWFFTGYFAGTSSAAAILAGSCVLVESAYKQILGYALPPAEVRDLLQRTGSPQTAVDIGIYNGEQPGSRPIGPLPDLQRALNTLVPRADFDRNRSTDILWRNFASGENSIWLMNGPALITAVPTNSVPDLNWQIAGTADFNGDGKTDLLWRNKVSGQVDIWIMDGANLASAINLTTIPPVWRIEATGDLNGDGNPDLIWRNKSTGEVSVWLMNGTQLASIAPPLPTVGDLNWSITGTGDFTRDGKIDLLWRNRVSGEISVWRMDGTTLVYPFTLATIDPVWEIVGTGDFNRDGKTDLLWRNQNSGEVDFWYMDGTQVLNVNHDAYTVGDLNWRTVGPR